MFDPIADMISRIKNAIQRFKETVDVPASKIKTEIARILQEEGFISGYELKTIGPRKILRITLKYILDPYGRPKDAVIAGMRRVSRPSCRIYTSSDIPRLRSGFGISIISTNLGVITDAEARQRKVGGEVICQVW